MQRPNVKPSLPGCHTIEIKQIPSICLGYDYIYNHAIIFFCISVKGCYHSADSVKLREDIFEQLFKQVNLLLEVNNLENISLPHQRRPPGRYRGSADETFVAASAMDHYRAIFSSICEVVVYSIFGVTEYPGLLINYSPQ